MKYRREIDGLRAVAVLPVILFHAGFSGFSGGFIGVDVFFVISGYLITTIILADKEKGEFSLVTFYERRARRILPALFFVMFCCIPFAWFWLLPNHLKDFSKSLVAVSAFSSNILFWRESGYFGTASELKPLLHTWSLAVEEQFYFLFPLFIMFMWKLRKRWIFGSLILIAVASLTLAQWGAHNSPAANFFLLPTRGWELAIGALIAFYFFYKKDHAILLRSKKSISEIFGFVGIALIAYSIYAFDQSTPFPSVYSLIPTIGTGLIIAFTTPQTIVGRFLGTKIMVGIGLISYSTYLWHQPLFVFARHRSLTEPSVSMLLSLSVASIFLAYLSWRYVEMPFRDRRAITKKMIFSFAVVGSVFFFGVGVAGHVKDGWHERVPAGLYVSVANAKKFNENRDLFNSQPSRFIEPIDSYTKTNDLDKYVYLIGDSYAESLAGVMDKAIESSNFNFGLKILTYSGCPPVENVYRKDLGNEHKCYEHNKKIYDYIASNDAIEYVVLSSRWQLYLEGERFDNLEGGRELGSDCKIDLIVDGNKIDSTENNRYEYVKNAYMESIDKLLKMNKKVVIVYPIPEHGWDVPDYLLKTALWSKESSYTGSTSYSLYKLRTKGVSDTFDSLGENKNLYRIKPDRIFCDQDNDRCKVAGTDGIYYRDDDHLSFLGANLVVEEILSLINSEEIVAGRSHIFQAGACK